STRGLDTYRDQHVRVVLGELAELAARADGAFVIVAHLNKAPTNDAFLRVANSIAFWNTSRSVILVTPGPYEPDTQRLVSQQKANYAPLAPVERHVLDRIQFEQVDPNSGEPTVTSRMRFLELVDDIDRGDVLETEGSCSPSSEA